MRELAEFLDEAYVGHERVSRDEVYRRAVAAGLSTEIVQSLDSLPEGEYAQDEIVEVLQDTSPGDRAVEVGLGVPAAELDDQDLLRELGDIHRARHETLRHGSDHALATHTGRMADLEGEYLRRFPDREIDPQRLRSGARARGDGEAQSR